MRCLGGLLGGLLGSLVAGWATAGQWEVGSWGLGNLSAASYPALAVHRDGLMVGGQFTEVGGIAANNIARWDGRQWQVLGTGLINGVNGQVLALAVAPDGILYVGGMFSLAGNVPAWNVARWDGTNWSGLGGGILGSSTPMVRALAVGADGRVYAGGSFDEAGGVMANNIAVWDGAVWSALGDGVGNIGEVARPVVLSLAWSGSRLVVGGRFSKAGEIPAGGIAQWNGEEWMAMGSGIARPGFLAAVDSIAVRGHDVFIGGNFTEAGGVAASGVARWDGAAWSALGAGLAGRVSALVPMGGDLFAGGDFLRTGDADLRGLARWDGAAWTPLGNGLGGNEPFVSALAVGTTNLWVTGRFTTADNRPASGSASWIPSNAPPVIRLTSPAAGDFLPIATPDGVTTVMLMADVLGGSGAVERVEWFNGTNRLGETLGAPFSFAWAEAPAGRFVLWARVTDSRGETGYSQPADVVIDTLNLAPVISLTAPVPGAQFNEGDTVTFRAEATDPDGTVDRVEWYTEAGVRLGTDLVAPYEWVIGAAEAGLLRVFAVATDERGARTRSTTTEVRVNARPLVRIVHPIDGAVSVVTNELVIAVEASDPDGRVTRVTLLRDGYPLASMGTPPYRFMLLGALAATNVYRATAEDDAGVVVESSPVQVFHLPVPEPYAPPQVRMISPTNHTIVRAPAEVTLVAETLTQGAPFQFLEFRVGDGFRGLSLNRDYITANPSRLTLSNLAVGSHTFIAVGFDLFGGSAESEPVTVTVESAESAPRYRLEDIGTLGGGAAEVAGVNDSGVVTGSSQLPNSGTVHAFVWQSGILRDLGPVANQSFARDVDGAGRVLGVTAVGGPNPNSAFVWNPIAGIRMLPGLEGGTWAMNGLGAVVGASGAPGMPGRPVLWREATGIQFLGASEGIARGINDRGQVVGSMVDPGSSGMRAFLWEEGSLTVLGTLTGETTVALGINEVGQVVGASEVGPGLQHAVLWEDGIVKDLGTLPGRGSRALNINVHGVAVGFATTVQGAQRAVVWHGNTPHDLNQWVDGLDGRILVEAVDINGRGQIAGVLFQPSDGTRRAFLLTPEPVVPSDNRAPLVQWVEPVQGQRGVAGEPMRLVAQASDPDGTVARVDFMVGTRVVGTVVEAPYELDWAPEQSGEFCLRAVAVDSAGALAVSSTTCVRVEPSVGAYEVVDLGPLAAVESRAMGINQAGDFTGFTRDEGFIDAGGVVTRLKLVRSSGGSVQTTGINDAGVVSLNIGTDAYLYQDGEYRRLPFLSPFNQRSLVRGLNNAGLAVGHSRADGSGDHATLFREGQAVDLGTLGGQESDATAINNAGVVVGWSQVPGGGRAFRWTSESGMEGLPGVEGRPISQAWAINDAGVIAGLWADFNGGLGLLLWGPEGVVEMGRFDIGESRPYGINGSNQVVGVSARRAFLWQTNRLHDLNDLIVEGSPWTLMEARGINDAGQIVGFGLLGAVDPTPHAFLLNPNPGPARTNRAPRVTVVQPVVGEQLLEGDDLTVTASVRDQEGLVTQVEFFDDTRLLGRSVVRPYALVVTNPVPGMLRLTAVATDSSGARGTSAPVWVEIRGFNTNAPRVAVIGMGAGSHAAAVRTALRRTERFRGVDAFVVTGVDTVPSEEQLREYDAVLVQGVNVPASQRLGDRLAVRLGEGVGVVLGLNAGAASGPLNPVTGRMMSEGLMPWTGGTRTTASRPTLVPRLASHPVLDGVTRLAGLEGFGMLSPLQVTAGSQRVAEWSNGAPLAVTRWSGSGRVVGLNLHPASREHQIDSWDPAGDGTRLVANALAWAAGGGNSLRVELVLNDTNTLFHPGAPISLTAFPTNVPDGGVEIVFHTNNSPARLVAGPPFNWTWSNAPVGIHLLTAVARATNGDVVASRPITVTVDSRMTVVMTSPVNGSVVAIPTNLFLAVAITNADAAIARVQFLRDGNELLGTVLQPPYQLTFGPIGIGMQNLSARVTDVLGAVRVTETVRVNGINLLAPQMTIWAGGTNAWTNAVSWSAGIPRPQDGARILSNGMVELSGAAGVASNLWVGTTSAGRLMVSNATLGVGRLLMLGESSGSTGSMVVGGTGVVTASSLFVGFGGDGTFEQDGGSVTATEFGVGPDGGVNGLYTLKNGVLSTRGSYIGGARGSGFRQTGGVHRVDGGLVVGTRNARTGFYTLSGGRLETVVTRIGAASLEESELRQTGGVQVISEMLGIGTEGAGRLVLLEGTVDAGELDIDSGGTLELAVGGGREPIRVSGRAVLEGRLFLRYKAGFEPDSTNEIVVMTYGSRSGEFRAVELPPVSRGVSWSLEYRPTAVVLVPQPAPNQVVISPLLGDAEPGLFSQVVRIVNHGREPLMGARVYVPGLPAAVELFNVAGVQDGVPYAEYGQVIEPGQTIGFTLQFLSRQSGRMAAPSAVVALGENGSVTGSATPLRILDPEPVSGGGFTLRFHPELNRSYRIEYSADLIQWSRAAQTVIGTGSAIRWTDDGPPKTTLSVEPGRYYRVVPAP